MVCFILVFLLFIMSDGWGNLEEKMKKIQSKKSDEAASKPVAEEKPYFSKKPSQEKSEYTQYMERVKKSYKSAKFAGGAKTEDKYEGMFNKLDVATLGDERMDETQKHFKGMEKRFLKTRGLK